MIGTIRRVTVCTSILLIAILLPGCSSQNSRQLYIAGVSEELAAFRKSTIDNLEYKLFFNIPENKDSVVQATLELSYNADVSTPLILDFIPLYAKDRALNLSLLVNGKLFNTPLKDEHIVVPSRLINKGRNIIHIEFIAGAQSLNRREDLLYTLLVPDRARTLFPCIDQPNLKARYSLTLEIPATWRAVANGALKSTYKKEGRVVMDFAKTEPIPTYLFAFVAGRMFEESFSKNNREIKIFHREEDSLKLSQLPGIANQIFYSLDWLEEYTGVEYPFSKYDIAIIPGFQYGGMEHIGATLYAHRTMFLERGASINEELARAKLIAHETAHMWFGDYVTMCWFNEVWTKEIFANWFAAKIVSPLYPQVNHKLNFINSYFPAAYSEDRTAGANAINRELRNLNRAGLIYGNIIYNKAPIVLEMLVKKVGEDRFKEGVREYLKSYAYSNATWDNLISILENKTGKELKSWSDKWVNESGMPHIITEFDTIPNSNGEEYGLFVLDSTQAESIAHTITDLNSEVSRLSALINIYENADAGYIPSKILFKSISSIIELEKNLLIFTRAVNYASSHVLLPYTNDIEKVLWSIVERSDNLQKRGIAFRKIIEIAQSQESLERLLKIWREPNEYTYVVISHLDLIRISYLTAIAFPEYYNEIKEIQRDRLESAERLAEFDFVFPSVSPDRSVRDSVFKSLLKKENREIEPWATQSLSNLNHRLRECYSIGYIDPSLEILEEIRESGDIFFPTNWLRSLLSGHTSLEAGDIVKRFLERNSQMDEKLISKILQQSHHLR